MKECPECGSKVKADAKLCLKCGFKFEEENSTSFNLNEIYQSELDPLREKIVEKYDIVGFIGKGGFSTVFKLKDKDLDRFCALKILSKDLLIEKEMVERFKLEARLYAKLEHPNIVPVYDVGFYNNVAYILMKYIDGINLKDYIKEHSPLKLREIVSITRDLSSVLEYMHSKGIVHRDIKPANVMMRESDGRAILTDFGLAKSLDTSKFTATGRTMGSPQYLSPEQAKGEDVDLKSDIYSLGVSVFEMSTGQVPFSGKTPVQVIMKHIREQMPKPSTMVMDIHPFLEKIILKSTRKNPSERYLSVSELVKDLEKLDQVISEKGVHIVKKKTRWIQSPVFIAAGLLVFLFILYLSGVFPFLKKDSKSGVTPVQKPDRKNVVLEPMGDSKGEKKRESVIVKKIPVSLDSNARSTVYIGDELIGAVPPKREVLLLPGKYKIKYVKEGGHQTQVKDVEVNEGRDTVSISHQFNLIAIIQSIQSDPYAKVFLDKRSLGFTPLKQIKIKEGKHKIRLVKSGFHPFIKIIKAEGGKNIPDINVKLEKMVYSRIGMIHVFPWGNISVDGRKIGMSPLRNVRISSGEHIIKIEHPKFKTVLKKIKVEKGKDIPKISFVLSEKKK